MFHKTPFAIALGAIVSWTAPAQAGDVEPRVLDALGLMDGRVTPLRASSVSGVLSLDVMVAGMKGRLELEKSSTRSPSSRVLVGGRSVREVESAPVSTYRGDFVVDGKSVGRAAASVLPEGIFGRVILDRDGSSHFIQPAASRGLAAASPDDHVVFQSSDSIPEAGVVCGALGLEDEFDASHVTPRGAHSPPQPMTLKVCELAIDCDYEYYQIYGSAAAVQARVETVLNVINVQYERDVAIRLTIGTLVVRDTAFDPYTSTNSSTLLDELRDEWRANYTNVDRDTVHLFTGKEIDSNIIGLAYLGAICGSYAYGLSQVDFSNNLNSSADLIAHEIGHNFDADHCNCTSHTMNPYVVTANQFHPDFTVPTIESFRDSINCLDTTEDDGGGGGQGGDTTAPTVTILEPSANQTVTTSTLDIRIDASDASGIASVAFYLDSEQTPFATDTGSPYQTTLDMLTVSDGVHVLTVVATDSSANANTASTAVSFSFSSAPEEDPGAPFVDSNNDGIYSSASGDFLLSLDYLTDGYFNTARAESEYPGGFNAGLVIPESVGTISTSNPKGIVILSEGPITILSPIVVTSSSGSITIRSKSADITIGDPDAETAITLGASRRVRVSTGGSVTVEQANISSARVQIGGSSVDIDEATLSGSSMVLISGSSIDLNDSTVRSSSGRTVVRGATVSGDGATISGVKVSVVGKSGVDVPNSDLVACGSTSGSLVVSSSGSLDFTDSRLFAGKRVTIKKGDIDFTNAEVGCTSSRGKVAVKGGTVTVTSATFSGGKSSPKIKGSVVGTPTAMSSGTTTCP